jgi:hypothetical protein
MIHCETTIATHSLKGRNISQNTPPFHAGVNM